MKKLTWSCFVLAFLAGSAPLYSYAQQDRNVLQGAYVTLGGGKTQAKFKEGDFLIDDFFDVDNTDKGYKFSFGFKANRYLGFEVGRTNFGKFVHSADAGAAGSVDIDYKVAGWWGSALAYLPLGQYFELFGRLGQVKTATDVSTSNSSGVLADALAATGVPVDGHKTKKSTVLGAGAQINFPGHFGVRVEYEDYGEAGDQNITGRARLRMTSVSLMYRF